MRWTCSEALSFSAWSLIGPMLQWQHEPEEAEMPQQTVKFEQFFAAPREKVFAWFADHEKFGKIWPGRTRRIQASADGAEPNGLGSVREIRSAGSTFEETITTFEPPATIEYRITRGGPIKNHRGRLV